MLKLTDEQFKTFYDWDKQHKCELKEQNGLCHSYELSYGIPIKGKGLLCSIICGCGESVDLTNYNEW